MSTPPSQVGFSADGNCDDFVEILVQHFCCNGGNESAQAPTLIQGYEFDPHPQEVIMKESEDLIAAAVSNLTLKEREKAEDEIHCVGEVEETPELTVRSVREFQEVLQTTPHNQIYHGVALNQNRSYVENSKFQLKFIRANEFDIRKSVNQMMKFLKHKELWFGEEKVAQDIGPEDMNEEEIALMRSGFMQILKNCDPSGRVILYISRIRLWKHLMHINDDERKLKTLIHVVYHIIFNVLIEMEDVQTKGIVLLNYEESKRDEILHPGVTFQRKVRQFFNSLPFRISSFHMCFNSSPETLTLFNKMFQVALRNLSKHVLARTRIHYGSDMERQYKLRTFGIPIENNFPVDMNGNIQTAIQKTWCQRSDEYLRILIRDTDVLFGRGQMTRSHAGNLHYREPKDISLSRDQKKRARINNAQQLISSGTESTNPSVHSFVEPTDKDVLLGRGKGILQHPGNIRFREFLQAYQEEYNNTPRYERVTTYTELTISLLQDGVRFLKTAESGDGWVEADFSEAEKKVKQFFRSQKKKTIS